MKKMLGCYVKDVKGHIWTEWKTERKLIGLRRILSINEELEARRRLKEGNPMWVRLWKEIELVPVVSKEDYDKLKFNYDEVKPKLKGRRVRESAGSRKMGAKK